MDFAQIPIHGSKMTSPQISREKLIKVYSNIALQYFPPDGKKVKISNLFMEIRTHRIILEDKSDPSRYFEIHFDRLVNEPQPLQRGLWRKEVYKLAVTYTPLFVFELKDANRGNFEEQFNLFRQSFRDSQAIVV